MKIRFVIVAAICFLAGCAAPATGPVFSGPEEVRADQALVYLYRPAHEAKSRAAPQLTLDGSPLLRLPELGYTFLRLPPGDYTFGTEKPGVMGGESGPSATLTFAAGHTYYIAYRIEGDYEHATFGGVYVSNVGDLTWVFELVNSERALDVMKTTRFVPLPEPATQKPNKPVDPTEGARRGDREAHSIFPLVGSVDHG